MKRVLVVIGRVLFLVSVIIYVGLEFIVGPISSVLGIEWYSAIRVYVLGLPALVLLIGGLNLIRKAGDGI